MRNILAAAAVATAALAGSAGAAVVNLDFVATGFTGSDAALLAEIGSGGVTGRFTYDDAAGLFQGGYFGPDLTFYFVRFLGSLSVTINGVTYEATPPTLMFSDENRVIDPNVDYDEDRNVFMFGDDSFVGPGGVAPSLFQSVSIRVEGNGNRFSGLPPTTWDGVTPTAAQLNGATYRGLTFGRGPDFLRSTNVTFSSPDLAPIPLPAGGVLLLSAMAGLALICRRRA